MTILRMTEEEYAAQAGEAVVLTVPDATPRDGGQAFPRSVGPTVDGHSGMSLRDYFAGQALVACMSSDRWVSGLDKAAQKFDTTFSDALAETVYRYADALLRERDKGKS